MTDHESLLECIANARMVHSILTDAAPHARLEALAVLDTVIRDLAVLTARAELPETAALVDDLTAIGFDDPEGEDATHDALLECVRERVEAAQESTGDASFAAALIDPPAPTPELVALFERALRKARAT